MKTEKFMLDEELTRKIQKKSIESTGYEKLVIVAMAENEYTISKEKINLLLEKYNEAFKEFEVAKKEVTKIVSEKYGKNSKWDLNFDTNEVTVEIEENE